jgi:hypothetical protein
MKTTGGFMIDFKRELQNGIGGVYFIEEKSLPGMGCLTQYFVSTYKCRTKYLVNENGKVIDPNLTPLYDVSNKYDLDNFQEVVLKLLNIKDEKLIEKTLALAEEVINVKSN